MTEEKSFTQFYYKKSRIQQLKGFCYTYQEGSVTKASEKMGLGVSTVTMQIKALEDDLNTKLFNRIKNKLTPTKKGEVFYQMALPIISSADGLFEKFLIESREDENNKIRVGAYHVIFSHILPKHIKKIISLFPKANLLLENMSRSEAYEKLRDDKIDIGIYPVEDGEAIPSEFESVGNFEYDLVLILNKNNPLAKKPYLSITKNDIINNNFIYHLNKNIIANNSWIKFVNRCRVKSNITIESGTWEMVKELVRADIGVGIVSKVYIDTNDKDIVTKPLAHLFVDFRFNIVVRKNGYLNELSQEFIKLINTK